MLLLLDVGAVVEEALGVLISEGAGCWVVLVPAPSGAEMQTRRLVLPSDAADVPVARDQ